MILIFFLMFKIFLYDLIMFNKPRKKIKYEKISNILFDFLPTQRTIGKHTRIETLTPIRIF